MLGRPAASVDPDGVVRHYVIGRDGALWTARQNADGSTGQFVQTSGTGRYGLSVTSVTAAGTEKAARLALPRPRKVR
jgi:hypothetical protein